MDLLVLPWKVGRHPYRSIHAITGDGLSLPVGSMQTPEVAARLVADHNKHINAGGFGGGDGGF